MATPKHIDVISILRDNGRFGANELGLVNQFSSVHPEDVNDLVFDVNNLMTAAKAEAIMRELGLFVHKEATPKQRELAALHFGSYHSYLADESAWFYLLPLNDGEKWFGRQTFNFLRVDESGNASVYEFSLDDFEKLKIDDQLDGKFPIWHLLCFFETGCDDHFWTAIELIQNAGGNFETVGF